MQNLREMHMKHQINCPTMREDWIACRSDTKNEAENVLISETVACEKFVAW
jgi:hypothetical protein